MKAKHWDCHANVTIEFNSQCEAILSPDGDKRLLPCDECGELMWRSLNVVSFLCPACSKEYSDYQYSGRVSSECEGAYLRVE